MTERTRRVLILDKYAHHRIRHTIEHARANPIWPLAMEAMKEGILPPLCKDPDHTVRIDEGFVCVFAVEVHLEVDSPGRCRHLAVAVDEPKHYPSKRHVESLMRSFGFKARIEGEALVWVDECAEAVNVVEMLE